MKKITAIGLLFIVCSFYACKQNKTKEVFLRNSSITTGYDTAKAEGKGLILISNKTGCSMCELFEVDLMKDEDYAKIIYNNFVLQRVDENVMGNKWLSRILNRGSFPICLFFNPKMELIGIEMGAINKKQMQELIEKTNKGDKWVDQSYHPGNETNIPYNKLLSYVESSYKAQLYWTQFRSKQKQNFDKIEPALKTSIAAYSTFFNNHLLARYYAIKKDTTKSLNAAKIALAVNDAASLYFNSSLRTELKMIGNPNYDIYSEPYIGIAETEQNFGHVKFGDKKIATFKITNLGREKLLFTKTLTDCNCTIADYPKQGIKPKESGIITINFSATKAGEFTHMAEIGSNAINAPLQLTIKGLVQGD
jgi:thioredoxin-related protein